MTYKKQLTILLSIIGALCLIYILSMVFDPERVGSRSAAYTWLDSKLINQIDRISISSARETNLLVRKNNEWFVAHNGKEYPARQLRVDDFIGIFTKRAPYPLRSSSPSSHERLGLAEETAARITISGGAGLPLLDILVGLTDTTGRDVYLRRQGQNEVRSGENKFNAYISGARSSWYNLRLFPESEDAKLDVDGVQRLTVHTAGAEPQVFTRWNREWTFSGLSITDPDMGKVDAYIRGILNTEGDDFDETVSPADPMFDHSRLTLELGNGSVRTLRLSAPGEDNRRYALVSGSDYVYSLAGWAAERLFKTAADFEKQ
ncbi:hypothetical protein AGMMS50293_03750 [Spirochaetia bacterium]|nr:hypothetical protein AGMMS50293_03750 [Spirochaetia bacterium]